jgi:hypothetical protein
MQIVSRMTIQPLIVLSAAAIAAASQVNHGSLKYIGSKGARKMIATLNVTTHDYTNSDESYQFWITSGMKLPSGQKCYWDIGAFIAVTGADAVEAQTMFINGEPSTPTTVIANATVTSTASNHDLATDYDTRGTLTTAVVRHGFIGDWLSWTLASAGTSEGPITFEIGAIIWS